MPELARFFGIVIRMYRELGEPHHQPHFHAYYENREAVFSIVPFGLLAGSLPRSQKKLIKKWAGLHRHELLQDWNLLMQGRTPNSINPLRK